MEILKPTVIFFSLILIIGMITTFTDLRSKKIYNNHLIIGATLSLLATIYTVVFKHENITSHIINGLIAFIIGLLLYRSSLWRGGDAKLFTLYAYLIPAPAYTHLPFPTVVSVFACSFIAGTLILFPIFVKDIIINHQKITDDLFLPTKLEALFLRIMRVIFYSWILFPLYYLLRNANSIIFLTIIYIIFSMKQNVRKEPKKDYIVEFFKKYYIKILLFILLGFLMRLWLSPNSLSFLALTRYIIMITLSTAISIFINTTFDHFKDYQERVPFAPLLFIGCMLSYTPFLTRLMQVMAQWNVLLYR